MSAHRLDEYLQATIPFGGEGTCAGIHAADSRVAVSSAVIATIDSNADGVISEAEKWAYAKRRLLKRFVALG